METKNIQTTFSVPNSFSEDARKLVAQMIIEKIQENTSIGKDRYGANFKSYSKEYMNSLDFKNAGKSSLVNLESTGDMMISLELISSRVGSVVIGYKSSHPDAGKVEGNQIGSYGGNSNSGKARPFIGVPQKQLDLIIANVKETVYGRADIAIQNGVDSIIQNLLGRFNQ